MPKRVTFADPPIPAVNIHLGSLLSRNLPGCIDGFALRIIAARHALSAPFADCPLSVPWHDVLTFASHGRCPCFSLANQYTTGRFPSASGDVPRGSARAGTIPSLLTVVFGSSDGQNTVEDLRIKLAGWFDEGMNRVSGWYKC